MIGRKSQWIWPITADEAAQQPSSLKFNNRLLHPSNSLFIIIKWGGGLWRFYGLWALDVTAVDYVTTNHPHAQSAALNPTLSRGAQLGSSSVGHKKSLISRPVA